jgi:5-methylcytosine-specific restriction endonuclease McrA
MTLFTLVNQGGDAMAKKIPGTSLTDYGVEIYEKYHYTCVYCGFDGRPFDAWMQLSIDHIRPKNSGGTDESVNLIVSCRSCNSITSKMKFERSQTKAEILRMKREKVSERRKRFYNNWLEAVAPRYLKRPLPKVDPRSND